MPFPRSLLPSVVFVWIYEFKFWWEAQIYNAEKALNATHSLCIVIVPKPITLDINSEYAAESVC